MGDAADDAFFHALDEDFDFYDDDFDERSGRGIFKPPPRGLDVNVDRRNPIWCGSDGPILVADMSDERLRNVMRWVERQPPDRRGRTAWLEALRAEAHKRPAFLTPDDPFRNITLDAAPPVPEIDAPMSTAEALHVAYEERFGESGNEDLATFLSCEAFEARFDQRRCRAFKAAARIVAAALRTPRRGV